MSRGSFQIVVLVVSSQVHGKQSHSTRLEQRRVLAHLSEVMLPKILQKLPPEPEKGFGDGNLPRITIIPDIMLINLLKKPINFLSIVTNNRKITFAFI